MGTHRLKRGQSRVPATLPPLVLIVCMAFFAALAGCTATPPVVKKQDFIKENLAEMKSAAPVPSTPKVPDFIPVTEDISPVKTRMVDIVARNTPLSDVLHVIAEATGLNLVIGPGVSLDRQVTISLRNVSAEDALATIFTSLDYLYTIKDNMLAVDAVGTKIFELGHPALIQGYAIDIGGDILGSATSSGQSGGGGGGSSGGNSTIKGTITQTGKTDGKAFDFWESLETSLNLLLGKKELLVTKVATTDTKHPATDSSKKTTSLTEKSISATTIERPPEESGGGRDQGGERSMEQSLVVNRLTGTIVVTATKKTLEKMEQYLDTVRKVLNRQVLIEARIVEVQLSDGLKYGVDWSFLDNFKEIGGTLAAGYGSLNIPTRDFNSAVDSAAPAFRIGTSRANFQTLLTALKEQGDVKTLSNPRVNVMNGQAALLSVGRNTSFISRVSSSTTASAGSTPTTTFTVETSSILSGIIIGLIPYINDKGEISLSVTPIVSELVKLQDKSIGSSGGDQINISLPTVDLRELSTTVKVRGGEMIVIGGLISKKENVTDEKVPILGDIPGLGLLFTRKDRSESRSELVLVLQPFLFSPPNEL